ncbi:MAG: bifunctional nicotinamidase/pyrazinamidase [Firmicutes bacterium]|jgi:nicotinamidase/pyrazinamidase|nr:bifunctional nicotinamidase/pyrazinamidase [Bacillota bacterium]
MRQALVIVDAQNDFFPGGALAVPHGDDIIPVLNRWLAYFMDQGLPIALTQDFHPANHCSFHAQGGPWPPHCVQQSVGAAFYPALASLDSVAIFRKGSHPDRDAYSGFEGVDEHGLGLAQWLHQRGVQSLIVGGLATDYCVRATVLDGLGAGFSVTVLENGIRGVEANPGDSSRAIADMISHGALVTKDAPPS